MKFQKRILLKQIATIINCEYVMIPDFPITEMNDSCQRNWDIVLRSSQSIMTKH
jgi:hypothetical protein